MNNDTQTYLQALLAELTANLARRSGEQGLKTGLGTLSLLAENVRWLSEPAEREKERTFRRVLISPTGCGKRAMALACARALVKIGLNLPGDDDTAFARTLVEKSCMKGLLEAGTPVVMNARKAMMGEHEPESLQEAIDAAVRSTLGRCIDVRRLGRLLLVIDGIDQIRDAATQDRFVKLMRDHLAASDDGLLLPATQFTMEASKKISSLPGTRLITLGTFPQIMESKAGEAHLRDYLVATLGKASAELVMGELENGELFSCLRSADDLEALTEIARARRPLPLSRRGLYEEYAEVVQSRADNSDEKRRKGSCSIERLAMLCSQARCAADASKAIIDFGAAKEVEEFCQVNDEHEWEFRSQSLQSFLTTKAIERGESGMEGSIGVDALLLVRDRQIKSEAIEFLSVSIHPDQQILLIQRLKDDGDAEPDLALAYLPKPESAEAASVLYQSRFEDGVYLSDAFVLIASGRIEHRRSIDAFLAREDERLAGGFVMLRTILGLQQRQDEEERVTFSWRKDAGQSEDLAPIVVQWLQVNGAGSLANECAVEKRGENPAGRILDSQGNLSLLLQGVSMLPNASSRKEVIEAVAM